MNYQQHRLRSFIVGVLVSGLVLKFLGGQVYGQDRLTTAAVRQEKLEIIEEFSAPAHSQLFPDQTYTPVSTFNRATYVVWVDPSRYPMVARIEGKNVQTRRLDPNDDYKPLNNGHNKFSLGIDNDGYIHVVGDMHHHPIFNKGHLPEPYRSSHCMYWVSDNPEDISSFSFMGTDSDRTIQGTSFTYYFFDNDNDGVLYFASRVRTNMGPQDDALPWNSLKGGAIGYGLQKYDPAAKTWTALGGDPSGNQNPVIAWEDNGADGGAYQSMRADIRFDRNNRLHFATTINADDSNTEGGLNSRSMTHVIYACSDDGGEAFHKADGTPIATLPMRVEEGPSQADIVAGPIHWISMPASVAFTKDNEPFVHYLDLSSGAQAKYTQWNAQSGWSTPEDLPLNATAWDKQYNDGRGVITLSSVRSGFYRTADLREEGVMHNTPFFCADRRYLRDTGELRGLSKVGNQIKVIRLKTSIPKTPR